MNEKRVRIVDIAEELGISIVTVSNVSHGKTKKMMLCGLVGSLFLSCLLFVYVLVSPVKVQNMIQGAESYVAEGRWIFVRQCEEESFPCAKMEAEKFFQT